MCCNPTMRIVLMLSLLALTVSPALAQTPPATAPRPAQPAAQPPAPARRPAAAVPSRAGMAITVTDPTGVTLRDVQVEVLGVSDRSGLTNTSGQINFTAMQPGTYRVRFSGETVITFEKEVVVRAGQIADLDVTMSAAPPPPPPPPAPEPPPPAAPAVGPPGMPLTVSIVDLIEKELIPGNQPRRETLVSCSGNTRSTLIQLNQDQPDRLYDTAEVTYYVVAGQGAVRINGRETALVAGAFVSVPRGTGHGLVRRGRNPLIVLTTLNGVACEEVR